MALESIRKILQTHNYEAYMASDEDCNIKIWFPKRKQEPIMEPELTIVRYSPENMFFSVTQGEKKTEGNLDVGQYAFRTITFIKAIANCVKWGYPRYLLSLIDYDGNYVERDEFYNKMLPFELDERLEEEDEAFNLLVTKALSNNFSDMFDTIAEQYGYSQAYHYTKNLYLNTIGGK